ncbi:LamG domain-containing protein, partial [Gemmobacter serpentinus]|uniref:LamG domain-containing protein n=1 Tax=Gemmobacter serpentinus TaxID=2652247 RepID=UPI001CF66AB6
GGMDFRGGFQMETGNTATPYQRVDTDLDVTEAGVPEAWYLSLDGIDDCLSTAAIDWGTDEVTVIAGVAKQSDTGNRAILELSANSDANTGAFFLFNMGDSSGYRMRSKGSTQAEAGVSSGWPVDTTHIVALEGKIGSDTARLRINGAQRATSTADQGNGSYGNHPLYIGARGGGTFPFAGQLYGLFAINRSLTPTELALTERWMATRCGVILP